MPNVEYLDRTRDEVVVNSKGVTNQGQGSDWMATPSETTPGESNATPGSSSVHQASPKSGADAALDVQDRKPLIERERLVYPASVSAPLSSLRQTHDQ
jgi:hypothetical protein